MPTTDSISLNPSKRWWLFNPNNSGMICLFSQIRKLQQFNNSWWPRNKKLIDGKLFTFMD
jgi:hypothetical protein